MRFLWTRGLSLRKARDVLERLAKGKLVPIEIDDTGDSDGVLSELGKLGVLAAILQPVDVNVKKVRERQDLSQPDFARLYGLEVDTVKNWEQGRYPLEGAAKVLLNVIDYDPEAVISAIFKGVRLDEHGKVAFIREFHWDRDDFLDELKMDQTVRPSAPEGYIWVLRPKHTQVR